MARTKKPGRNPLLPDDVNAKQRRNMALHLRLEGLSQQEIADQLGVNQSTVSRYVAQALKEEQAANVDQLRALEWKRMERLHRQMSKAAEKGSPAAANVIVRASERRSRLMGLDEAGEAGGSGATLVTVWIEAIVVDSEEAIALLLAEAEALGIAQASSHLSLAPGQIHATQTNMVRLTHVHSDALDPNDAKALISAAAHNQPWGI